MEVMDLRIMIRMRVTMTGLMMMMGTLEEIAMGMGVGTWEGMTNAIVAAIGGGQMMKIIQGRELTGSG